MNLFDRRLYVGIVGSRRLDGVENYDLVRNAFSDVMVQYSRMLSEMTIVSGGCPIGGDRFAELIAARHIVEIIIHRPDKSAHPDLPEPFRSTRQNYDRNTLIARDSEDVLIACVASDRTGGTEDTIEKFERLHPAGRLILV